ncbi:hypothetical protein T265_11487 [Opisthorchis viverrini]|uniref:Uncharacterized protein n=1 Tax=Opisthorchis viverrini TaxID=6198 RepID=A0A074Z9B0_OPIVI|nr:hypothetical protein T265_11487 [Opisthorchis viverrini]KER19835.1 hypothetical protein T265_11487 [Opisthorchis viverrini]
MRKAEMAAAFVPEIDKRSNPMSHPLTRSRAFLLIDISTRSESIQLSVCAGQTFSWLCNQNKSKFSNYPEVLAPRWLYGPSEKNAAFRPESWPYGSDYAEPTESA